MPGRTALATVLDKQQTAALLARRRRAHPADGVRRTADEAAAVAPCFLPRHREAAPDELPGRWPPRESRLRRRRERAPAHLGLACRGRGHAATGDPESRARSRRRHEHALGGRQAARLVLPPAAPRDRPEGWSLQGCRERACDPASLAQRAADARGAQLARRGMASSSGDEPATRSGCSRSTVASGARCRSPWRAASISPTTSIRSPSASRPSPPHPTPRTSRPRRGRGAQALVR